MTKITLLLFILFCVDTMAQTFEPIDVIISDTTVSIPDPEFSNTLNKMCFYDPSGLWVCDVDPNTGNLLFENGKQILIDSTVSIYHGDVLSWQGPEWAESANGISIFYTDSLETNQDFQISKAYQNGYLWQHNPLANTATASLKNTTQSSKYENVGILYKKNYATLECFRFENNPATERCFPTTQGNGGRWAIDTSGFTYIKKKQGIGQVHFFNTANNTTSIITTDAYNKSQSYMIKSSEYNNKFIVWCQANEVNESNIYVYKKEQGVWSKIDTIRPPSSLPYIVSPEPFKWNGKSYIVMQMSLYPQNNHSNFTPDEIWIASIEKNNRLYRKISTTATHRKIDPEIYLTPTGPVIYYSEVRNGKYILHKCFTGLH